MRNTFLFHLLAGGSIAIIFGVCAWNYLVPSGRLILTYPLKNTSPYVRLVPESRLSSVLQDELPYQKMSAEPVYLDIRTPGRFKSGTIHITYTNTNNDRLLFGDVKYGKVEHYYFSPLASTDMRPQTIDIPVDFSKLDYRDHRYRFAFSAPDLSEQSDIRIYHITAALSRPPL